MDIKHINEELERLNKLKSELSRQDLPKGPKRQVQYRISWKGPLFSLQRRCTNLEELKDFQKECLANYGRSEGFFDQLNSHWSCLMQYCITTDYTTGQLFLCYLGGGTIVTKTDASNFGYLLKITAEQKDSLLSGIIPRELIAVYDNTEFECIEYVSEQ